MKPRCLVLGWNLNPSQALTLAKGHDNGGCAISSRSPLVAPRPSTDSPRITSRPSALMRGAVPLGVTTVLDQNAAQPPSPALALVLH
jgi:hypothetical protein